MHDTEMFQNMLRITQIFEHNFFPRINQDVAIISIIIEKEYLLFYKLYNYLERMNTLRLYDRSFHLLIELPKIKNDLKDEWKNEAFAINISVRTWHWLWFILFYVGFAFGIWVPIVQFSSLLLFTGVKPLMSINDYKDITIYYMVHTWVYYF